MHSKEFPWAQYKPKDGILVVQPVWITEREIQFLMQLYAPFIGRTHELYRGAPLIDHSYRRCDSSLESRTCH